MAFDMNLDNLKEKINYHEEDLFMALEREEGYPNCNWLWEAFYSSPKIDASRSGKIADELTSAKELKSVKANRSLQEFIDRVVPFFRKSYVSNTPIKCISD